jgi:hypothetical protein
MNKFDRVVQIAEVVGALAVVISLLYVGSEIRQNTLAVQDTSHQNSLALGHDIEAYLFDEAFAETYESGLAVYSSLRGADKQKFDSFVSQNFNVWEYAFYARGRGTMQEDLWNGWDRWFRSQMALDAWKAVWFQRREGFGDQFQGYADSVASN